MTAQPLGIPVVLSSKRARQQSGHPIAGDPLIGKDILELLSSAMYIDPRAIYREYIQNAVDAIDAAFLAGLFPRNAVGTVEVTIGTDNRSLCIRDNGVGVPAAQAERVLTSLGASAKRGTDARGFRGVGRLAALGYAQSVVFRTKAVGERVSTEVTWDCRKLKAALLDPRYSGDLRQTIRDVVAIATEAQSDASLHYFEVVLERVVRIRNDVLLNRDEIVRYLRAIAPAPFHQSFAFGESVRSRLEPHIPACRAEILIGGSDEPVIRPHRSVFPVSAKTFDKASDVEFIELPDGEGGIRAIVWLMHHSYLGAFHVESELRGLRARIGDIQVGDEEVFANIFPEPRFNSWTVGEVHIIDRRILPNGRRDGFEQNGAYVDLIAQLVPIGREIARRCRHSSARRNRIRGITTRADQLDTLLAELVQGGASRAREQATRRHIGSLFGEIDRLFKSSMLSADDRRKLNRRMSAVRMRFEGLETITGKRDPFAGFKPSRRAAYAQMIELIYDCSANRANARLLVDRITKRLAASALKARKRRRKRQ
jgi:hypothetical protein